MTRRELLQLVASAPAFAFSSRLVEARQSGLDAAAFARAPWSATLPDGTRAPATVQLTRTWNNERCQSAIVNKGSASIALKEVTLFTLAHSLSPETPLYGEGFQMLSQTGGTVVPRNVVPNIKASIAGQPQANPAIKAATQNIQ